MSDQDRPTVESLREGLAFAAAALEGIRTSAYARDKVNPVEVVVQPPEQINFDRSFGGGAEYVFPVRIYAARVSERAGQSIIDRYISETGSSSLKAALEHDQTLGARADWVQVRQIRGYGAYNIGDVDYLGAELVVHVVA